jgi:hypothetical protein
MTLAARLVQARGELAVAPKDEHGSKAVTLARFSAYEVRLVQFGQTSSADAFAFWLELFDHNDGIAVNGGGTNDFGETLAFAEELVSQAEELSKG